MQSCSKRPHEAENILPVTKKISTRKQKRKKLIPKKYGGSFKHKVLFKSEWKVDFPIKEFYNGKNKFHYLPCGKNLSCYHQDKGDVRVHFSGNAHKTNVKS